MSDDLGAAFIELETAVRQRTRLPGLDAAYATVRRRRRNRRTVLAAALVLLLLPVVAVALLRGSGRALEIGPTPDVSDSTGAITVRPDRHDSLNEATLPVAAFEPDVCPHGTVKFHLGAAAGPAASLDVVQVGQGDVNQDGAIDKIALITCNNAPTINLARLAAYSRAAGLDSLIGFVDLPGADKVFQYVEVLADGSVRVTVEDHQEPTWYTYRWSGTAFDLVDGPVVPPAGGPTHLAVTAASVRTGREVRIDVSIHNGGWTESEQMTLLIRGSNELTVRLPTAADEPLPRVMCNPGSCDWSVSIDPVPLGGTVHGSIFVTLSPDVTTSTNVSVSVSARDSRLYRQFNDDEAYMVHLTL